ncbi:DUF2079 domain-containing protein [Thermodesulfobacteriota bacterium]
MKFIKTFLQDYNTIIRIGAVSFIIETAVWFFGMGNVNLHFIFMIPGLVCFIYIFSNWKASQGDLDLYANRLTKRLLTVSPRLFIILLIIVFGIAWGLKYTALYFGFGLKCYDVGIYNNLADNLANGYKLYSSILQRSHLGEHFSPIMFVFAPLYKIWPGHHWLLFVQLVAYLSSPFFIYLLAKQIISDKNTQKIAGLLLCVFWFFSRPMAAAMNYPFHPCTISVPFIFWAFYFLEKEKWVHAYIILIFLLTFKENLTLVWMGFGSYLFVVKRDRIQGTLMLLAGSVVGILLIKALFPYFRGDSWGHLDRIGPLADLPQKGLYFAELLFPFLFLPLIFWKFGIISFPAISINLIAKRPQQYSFMYHYDDIIAALLVISFLLSIEKLTKKKNVLNNLHRKFIFVLAILVALMIDIKPSPIRSFWEYRPKKVHFELMRDLDRLEHFSDDRLLYLQSLLVPHMNRYKQTVLPLYIDDYAGFPYKQGSLIVLSRVINPSGIHDFEQCISDLESRKDKFAKINRFDHLIVYKVLKNE